VFGPVWLVLYAMMALAASLVCLGRDICCPVSAFSIQLGLNLAWPVLFFGFHNPLLGLLDVCLLWVATGNTITQFFLVSRLAGWLMIPFCCWMTFVVVPNASIMLLGE